MKTVCVLLFVGFLSSIAYGEDGEWPKDIPGDVNRRIIGGRPALEGEFPYQVALRLVGSNVCPILGHCETVSICTNDQIMHSLQSVMSVEHAIS